MKNSELSRGQVAYRDYLKSDHWINLKKEKAKKVSKKCAYCGSSKKIHLHHLFYRSDWNDAVISDLRWLCENHHKVVHEIMNSKSLYPSKKKPFRANSYWLLITHKIRAKEKALRFNSGP